MVEHAPRSELDAAHRAGYAYLGSRIAQVRLQIVDIVQRVMVAAGRAQGVIPIDFHVAR